MPQPHQPQYPLLYEPPTNRWIPAKIYRTDVHPFYDVQSLVPLRSKDAGCSQGVVLTWDNWNEVLPCFTSRDQMNYVPDMHSIFPSIREYGAIWMGILFDEIFSKFREISWREDTWVSEPTPNYITEEIIYGPFPHAMSVTTSSLMYQWITNTPNYGQSRHSVYVFESRCVPNR